MEYSLKFLHIQIKRVMRILPKLLAISFLASACIGGAYFYWVSNSAFVKEKKNYVVGVVGDIEESYLGFGIKAVQTLDDSRHMVDFEAMSKEEARRRFIAGKIAGYIIIPDGLIESFSYGRNDKVIRCIVSDGQKDITGILIEELTDIVSTLVTQSQAAVFGMQNILIDRGRWDTLQEDTDVLNLELIEFVLERTSLAEEEAIGVSEGISVISYYICGLFVVVLILFGIDYSACVVTRSDSLNRIFKAKGVKIPMQVICEYLAYLVMLLLAVSGLVIMLSAAVASGLVEITEWGREPVDQLLYFLVRTIPVAGMIGAMQFLVYEFADNVVSSILFQFVAGIGMCYLSGCFYPKDMMPDAVTAVGDILPSGVAMSYLSAAVRGSTNIGKTAPLALYGIFFLTAACLVRNWRIMSQVK